MQLLAELCAGLANEVEMYVQNVVPLHEACAHICDSLCPYAVRASFLALLMEAYTVTRCAVVSRETLPTHLTPTTPPNTAQRFCARWDLMADPPSPPRAVRVVRLAASKSRAWLTRPQSGKWLR